MKPIHKRTPAARRRYFRDAKRRSRAAIRQWDPTYDRPIRGIK